MTKPTEKQALRRKQMATGFLVGVLAWLGFLNIVIGIISYTSYDFWYPVMGISGAFLAASRFRWVFWSLVSLIVVTLLTLGFTPVVPWMQTGWFRADTLTTAPVVVVLAADGDEGLEITEKGQARLLHGYEVVRQGYAPRMIVSRGSPKSPSWIPAIKKQMESLDLRFTLEETPEVNTTHDEAVSVANIAKLHGWKSIILVTHPVHMRRASAVFEKTGLKVIASPCSEWRYNYHDLGNFSSRLTAFREWMHELVGMKVYAYRDWI